MAPADLAPPGAGSKWWAVNLNASVRGERSKTGLCDENLLVDSVGLPFLGAALGKLAQAPSSSRENSRSLFHLDYPSLLQLWKNALAQLKLSYLNLNLYSLRHGGPSHDRLHSLRSLLETKERGRWKSDAAMRRYEAHAAIQKEFLNLPADIQTKATASAQRLADLTQNFVQQPGLNMRV